MEGCLDRFACVCCVAWRFVGVCGGCLERCAVFLRVMMDGFGGMPKAVFLFLLCCVAVCGRCVERLARVSCYVGWFGKDTSTTLLASACCTNQMHLGRQATAILKQLQASPAPMPPSLQLRLRLRLVLFLFFFLDFFTVFSFFLDFFTVFFFFSDFHGPWCFFRPKGCWVSSVGIPPQAATIVVCRMSKTVCPSVAKPMALLSSKLGKTPSSPAS